MGCLRLIKDGKATISIPLLPTFEIQIGRDEEQNEVVIFDPSISRAHARIFYENGGFYIQDLESRYGTFVNNTRISGAIALQDQAQILLGSTTLQYADRDTSAPRRGVVTEDSLLKGPQRECRNGLCGKMIHEVFGYCPHCGAYLG